MARTEPRFIDHLREQFVAPMHMSRHEHDHLTMRISSFAP